MHLLSEPNSNPTEDVFHFTKSAVCVHCGAFLPAGCILTLKKPERRGDLRIPALRYSVHKTYNRPGHIPGQLIMPFASVNIAMS